MAFTSLGRWHSPTLSVPLPQHGGTSFTAGTGGEAHQVPNCDASLDTHLCQATSASLTDMAFSSASLFAVAVFAMGFSYLKLSSVW